MSSRFNRASNAIAQRMNAMLGRARNVRDLERIQRAAMNMQGGLMEKGLANSGG